MTAPQLDFDGESYCPELDGARLSTLLGRVRTFMFYHRNNYVTKTKIMRAFPDTDFASVGARLRQLRKPKFGGYNIRSKRIDGGLWAYGLFTEGE